MLASSISVKKIHSLSRFFSSSSAKVIVGVNAIVIKDEKILLGRRLNCIDAGLFVMLENCTEN